MRITADNVTAHQSSVIRLLTMCVTVFQVRGRGRGTRAVAAIRVPVLRGERGRQLRRRVAGVPLAVARDPRGAAAPGAADQAQAGREQRVESAGNDIRQEQQQTGPEEAAVAEHMTRVGVRHGRRRSEHDAHAVKTENQDAPTTPTRALPARVPGYPSARTCNAFRVNPLFTPPPPSVAPPHSFIPMSVINLLNVLCSCLTMTTATTDACERFRDGEKNLIIFTYARFPAVKVSLVMTTRKRITFGTFALWLRFQQRTTVVRKWTRVLRRFSIGDMCRFANNRCAYTRNSESPKRWCKEKYGHVFIRVWRKVLQRFGRGTPKHLAISLQTQ